MRFMVILVAMVMFSGMGYSAETFSFTNDDVKKAPLLFKSNKVPSQPQVKNDAEEMEDEQSAESVEPEEVVEEKEEIVDSFVVLKGNRRYHLASCKLVSKIRGDRSTVNGAKAISSKNIPCSSCSPKAYKNPPKPTEKDTPEDKVADKTVSPEPAKKVEPAVKKTPKSAKQTPEDDVDEEPKETSKDSDDDIDY